MAVPSGPVSASSDAERAMFDFVDAYDRAYEIAAEQHGMSVAQACVLGRISSPRGMRELADELGCDASNITQIVTRLEARDLVERHANPADRRSRQLTRTPAGDSLNSAFEKTFEFARAAAANLSLDEQAQLAELLRKALGRPM
ncbi:MarR family winged helix-turn-helix transcriptional regulator [Antrihabitans stalactiti]|uniref:Winged helix-turn-helix transcriptional regulator n=1 Tax=Antrihabitans stalactiti TaxID=2584121 RepID=A0A848KD67_9NOCA|nr:MarR family winged helix-turn-helix transcriptional regulator [Antrihabitans stalactiti]NMN95498.1 winged helix-turn-helix transcriptional regulator [Antrihabitans stalactiti]